jgi:hypothetical protein
MRQKVEQLPIEADRRSIAVDLIWETVNGPLYQAWLELLIAPTPICAILFSGLRAAGTARQDRNRCGV